VRPDAVASSSCHPAWPSSTSGCAGRKSEDEATVLRRFRVARSEIEHYGLFDYVLLNDDLDKATDQLVAIVRAEECRRGRAARLAEALLAETHGFGGTVPPHSKE
jgi:guanylate kinase